MQLQLRRSQYYCTSKASKLHMCARKERSLMRREPCLRSCCTLCQYSSNCASQSVSIGTYTCIYTPCVCVCVCVCVICIVPERDSRTFSVKLLDSPKLCVARAFPRHVAEGCPAVAVVTCVSHAPPSLSPPPPSPHTVVCSNERYPSPCCRGMCCSCSNVGV